MKKIVYSLAFILVFFNPLNTLALDECTTSELKRLNELANNIEFKYEYEIVDERLTDSDEYTFKQVYYDITGLNLSSELIVRLKGDEEVRFTQEEPTIGRFINGETINIEMIAYTKNLCSGKTILTKTLKLPSLNTYSLKEECLEYKEFKYCQENRIFDISESEFQDALEEYKKELENKKSDNDIIDNEDYHDYMIYIYIGIGILLVIVIFLVIKFNKKKKDRDL